MKLDNDQLLAAGNILVGRMIPLGLGESPESISWERYLEMVGRPDLLDQTTPLEPIERTPSRGIAAQFKV